MRRPALGPQARAALHVAGEPVRFPRDVQAAPETNSPPRPSVHAQAAVARQRSAAAAELQVLRARVQELEAELEAVQRDVERRIREAVEDVERRQTEHAARTMGGAVLSIFGGK